MIPKGFFPEQDTEFMFGEVQGRQTSRLRRWPGSNRVSNIILADPAMTASSVLPAPPAAMRPKARRACSSSSSRSASGRHRAGHGAAAAQSRTEVIGAKFFMQPGQDITIGGRMEQAQYQYTLTDTNSNELNHWAPILLDKMQAMKILTDVASDQQIASPHIPIEVDRDAASRLGFPSPPSIQRFTARSGSSRSRRSTRPPSRSKLILEVQPQFRVGPAALSRHLRRRSQWRTSAARDVARFTNSVEPLTINHQGVFPAVTLSFNLAPVPP